MIPLGRLRWFLGRLISPVRAVAPGSFPSRDEPAEPETTDPAAPADDEEPE